MTINGPKIAILRKPQQGYDFHRFIEGPRDKVDKSRLNPCKTLEVLDMKVTDNRTHDSECAIGLIETARKKAEALGCKHEIFRYLGKRGIKPVIKVRKDAVITGNMARDKVVREIRRRWSVESFFSSFKRWFGEHVSSVKFGNIVKEIMFKVMIVFMVMCMDCG